MSDLLIKDMELPKDGFYEVTICGSGRVFYHPLGKPDKSEKTEAILLPELSDYIIDTEKYFEVDESEAKGWNDCIRFIEKEWRKETTDGRD